MTMQERYRAGFPPAQLDSGPRGAIRKPVRAAKHCLHDGRIAPAGQWILNCGFRVEATPSRSDGLMTVLG